MPRVTYAPTQKVNIGIGKDTLNDFARKYNLEIEAVYDILNRHNARAVVFYSTSDYWSQTDTGYKLSLPHNGNVVFAVYRTDSANESTQVLTGVKQDATNVEIESVEKFDGFMLYGAMNPEKGIGYNTEDWIVDVITELKDAAEAAATTATDEAEFVIDAIDHFMDDTGLATYGGQQEITQAINALGASLLHVKANTDTCKQAAQTSATAAQNASDYASRALTAVMGASAAPVGTVLAYAGSTAPDEWLVCDGSAVSRTTYADLFDVIGTTYGAGNGSTTFNLPDLSDKFVEGSGTNDVGDVLSAGLPNITGSLNAVWESARGATGTGAFSAENEGGDNEASGTGSGGRTWYFDASDSNSIYGNSDTVQPPAVAMLYIIKWKAYVPDSDPIPIVDPTLTISGAAADAEVTGKLLALTAERTLSPNFFPGYVESGYVKDNGTNGSNSNLIRSDYIELDTNESTIYVRRETGSWAITFFYYDADKTFLQKVVVASASSTSLTHQTTIPQDAKYLRTYRNVNNTKWVEFSYTQLAEYYPYGYLYNYSETIQKCVDAQSELTIISTTNIFDGLFPESGYFDADGVNASGGSFKRTAYIDIDDSNSVLYALRMDKPYLLVAHFYDTNKAGIGGSKTIYGNSSTKISNTLTIPSGAKYIRMYTQTAKYTGGLMLSYTAENDFIPYNACVLKDGSVFENNLSQTLQDKINANQFLNGKTIAFLGDSIIGNFYDSTGVCSVLAEKTGAEVINCAFGGSRIAYRYGSNIQYTYWNALSGVGLANAIASGDWTAQDDAVANMTGGLDYFADRLATIKDIDWSSVDYVMWEYGTNDFMTEVALSDITDPTNMYAYDNAYRHVIETILTAYPNIRIITVTPTYRWYESGGVFADDSNTHIAYDYKGDPHKLTDFVAMAQSISREYQIPCIDDYYTLGANKFTRLAFWNSNDGTHPNAQGRQRIAEHISAGLKGLV